MAELKPIAPNFSGSFLRRQGMADSTQFGNDLYYRLDMLNILIAYYGEEFVAQCVEKHGAKFKPPIDWKKAKIEIEEISDIIMKIKPVWDLLEEKKLTKIDKETRGKEEFLRLAGKIPLFGNVVTSVLVWVIMETQLQSYKVPSEAYKILEHSGYKTMEAKKVKTTTTSEVKSE
jgi:hypothetical protein